MTRWTLAALLLLCAAQASALDTFEPYPQGLRAAEVYAIRAGAGLGDPALRAFGAVTGVAVGLGVAMLVVFNPTGEARQKAIPLDL